MRTQKRVLSSTQCELDPSTVANGLKTVTVKDVANAGSLAPDANVLTEQQLQPV